MEKKVFRLMTHLAGLPGGVRSKQVDDSLHAHMRDTHDFARERTLQAAKVAVLATAGVGIALVVIALLLALGGETLPQEYRFFERFQEWDHSVGDEPACTWLCEFGLS
ncbi:MAG: hypothetical protein JW910_03320, partial [Anaerolineae bacterium]|nr:hypothetical protein [Anaerolineae bacterium]